MAFLRNIYTSRYLIKNKLFFKNFFAVIWDIIYVLFINDFCSYRNKYNDIMSFFLYVMEVFYRKINNIISNCVFRYQQILNNAQGLIAGYLFTIVNALNFARWLVRLLHISMSFHGQFGKLNKNITKIFCHKTKTLYKP